jgi:hypothetical protein
MPSSDNPETSIIIHDEGQAIVGDATTITGIKNMGQR